MNSEIFSQSICGGFPAIPSAAVRWPHQEMDPAPPALAWGLGDEEIQTSCLMKSSTNTILTLSQCVMPVLNVERNGKSPSNTVI
ncbi:hypothetical protein AV530_011694 [Patagioenas fasciata monilis]|uniref:Uncharacterized protein n=1 Tax=Patagioenas fasciata monilis TaxID=372326 RepID=A0A1V4KN84_PATFA|nr:hypothetical protein AV530_011694 [Patagioenas fasciata monilis]